jgi:cyclopropane-fatty-acyl-phospholipid synthase
MPRIEAVRTFLQRTLERFPWEVRVTDWRDGTWSVGEGRPHWCGEPLHMHLKTPAAGADLLAHDAFGFLERFVTGEVDLEGNLYAISHIRHHARIAPVTALRALPSVARNLAFQSVRRARANVRSHYDMPQAALDLYLDRVYRAYSCAIFGDTGIGGRAELLQSGDGRSDGHDSLEKAQWNKFRDAVDFVAPREGETLLDIGCGYGGQLQVALEEHPFGKVVGWTHSENQAAAIGAALSRHERGRWEVRLGDYREEDRVYDHVTSTGMVCHVGPRGLVPYVRHVRKRIRRGGRYLHHVIMSTPSPIPLDLQAGPAFNKKYVWPGFHWFTLGEHVRALERNGFRVMHMVNRSAHYAKTTATWYERMMAAREAMVAHVGEPTFRAWRVYLAGISGAFDGGSVQLNRIYCQAA